jgi:hypothetical protein
MHCLSPLSERTASPQPWQSESHVPPSQAGQGTLNCVQFRSVARTHLENVGFRFHSLRQPRRRQLSLLRCDDTKISAFCGTFLAKLCTAEPANSVACILSPRFFSRPLDYVNLVQIFYVIEIARFIACS